MQTVDPLPAQIASMDKSTVLRLLGLLTNGSLLKRGLLVEVGVSRWVWGLLARLPERGELTSEEIGVVREMGKKAVLVGTGLKDEKEWEAGINEMEAEFFADESGEELSYSNEEEIDLNINDGFENDEREHGLTKPDPDFRKQNVSSPLQQIGPQLPTEINGHHASSNSRAAELIEDGVQLTEAGTSTLFTSEAQSNDVQNGDIPSGEAGSLGDFQFAAAKARILARLNGTEEDEATKEKEPEADANTSKSTSAAAISKWNTRATVDMIITVAGEMYGQRDLLEFRSAFGTIT